jgi:hypothetical protein
MKTKKETLKIPWEGGFIEFPKPEEPKTWKAKRPYHDGIAYTQSCLDDEWERWEKRSLFDQIP